MFLLLSLSPLLLSFQNRRFLKNREIHLYFFEGATMEIKPHSFFVLSLIPPLMIVFHLLIKVLVFIFIFEKKVL